MMTTRVSDLPSEGGTKQERPAVGTKADELQRRLDAYNEPMLGAPACDLWRLARDAIAELRRLREAEPVAWAEEIVTYQGRRLVRGDVTVTPGLNGRGVPLYEHRKESKS